MRYYLKTIIVIMFIIMLFNTTIIAGVTGKISGVILHAVSGDPIEGATVRIEGTNIATQTDIDGEYYIINIPGGKYNVVVTSIGYETLMKKDVRVLVDLTTPVDFDINVTTIELPVKLVVVAENPIIQKDLTSSRITFTADRLKTIPNITTIQSVLTNYPGVVVDDNNSLHVRGGRSGQISYYYDGFAVHDPFVSNSGIRITPNSLEELTLTLGGFTAEYGEALSGVISAITREGGQNYQGSLKMYQGFTHSYDVLNADWSNLKDVGNRSASLWLAGPISIKGMGSSNFSVSGEYLHDPTSLPHNGFASYTGTAKFSLQPISKMRVISNFTYHKTQGEVYKHRDVNNISYDLNLDGLPVFKKEAYLIGISSNYHFNEKMIISAKINRFYTSTLQAPAHLMDTYWKDWPGYLEDSAGNYRGSIHDDNYLGTNAFDYADEANITGFTSGSDFVPAYRFRESEYNAFHIDLTNQINKHHQFKSGFEYRYYNISWDNKLFYNLNPYGEKYDSKPVYLSMYLQDKMEYEFFIINMGLRYDFRKDNILYNSTPEDFVAIYKSAESVSKVSPRFGISFPITEKSVMHFNYGLYYQVPAFTYMYTNLDGNTSSGYPLIGNPNLEPERTTSYELGLNHLVGNNLRFDITAFVKDVDQLTTTISNFKVAGNSVTTFENQDYGSVKGVDISIEKLRNNSLWSTSISYSYMTSKGISSGAYDAYYSFLTAPDGDTLAPVNEYPLDYDQRHTLTGYFDFRILKNEKVHIGGIKIPTDWGLSMVGYYGSGMPYTKTDREGNRMGERNEARLPSHYTVDIRFNKNFSYKLSDYVISFFVEVDNLFNKRNIIDVYTLTGRPDDDGFNPTGSLALSQEALTEFDNLYDHDPQNFSTPRTVRAGFEFNF